MSKTTPATESVPTPPAPEAPDTPAAMQPPSIQVRGPDGEPVTSRFDFHPINGAVTVHLAHPVCHPDTHRMISNKVWKEIIPILNAQPYEKVVRIFDALDEAAGK